jgi:hypothetical protein
MDEMVERVARALCARHSDNETDADQWVIDLDNHPVRYWTSWKEDARAAIEAMHEPTEAMTFAGQQQKLSGTGDVRAIYQAMIDAA